MKKRLRTPGDVQEDLKFLERFIGRLLDSFRIEKEAVLAQNNRDSIEKLREREKCYYSPAFRRMLNDLRQLRYRAGIMEELPSAIFYRLDELEKQIKEAKAHVTGVVNRLARSLAQDAGDDQCTE